MTEPVQEPALIRVSIMDLTEDDIKWLIRAIGLSYTGWKAEHVLLAASKGEMTLWRWTPGGIIITQVYAHPATNVLYIWSLAGQQMLRSAKEIKSTLNSYAKERGCGWVEGLAIRKGLERVYGKVLGADPWAVSFRARVE